MPITKIDSVDLRCNFFFEKTHFIEPDFDRNTIHIVGSASSHKCNEPFTISINGSRGNDHFMCESINSLIHKGRWVWKKDANNKIDVSNGIADFELALNINDLEGSNDNHFAGSIALFRAVGPSGEEIADQPEEIDRVFTLTSEITAPTLSCNTEYDDSGNILVTLLLPEEYYKNPKDRGYFSTLSLLVKLSLEENGSITQKGSQSRYIDLQYNRSNGNLVSIQYPSISDELIDPTYITVDDKRYLKLVVIGETIESSGIMLGSVPGSNMLGDIKIFCLDDLYVTATTHGKSNVGTNKPPTNKCVSEEYTFKCEINNLDDPPIPILKWSPIVNDFIITLPRGNSTNRVNNINDLFRHEKLTLCYNDKEIELTTDPGRIVQHDSTSTSSNVNTLNVKRLTVFNNTTSTYEFFDTLYRDTMDTELLWANHHNMGDIEELYGKEVTLKRAILYYDNINKKTTTCTRESVSNVVVPFSEHITTSPSGESVETINNTQIEKLVHRVYNGTDILSGVGNVQSTAPVSEIYVISPEKLISQGIGPADSCDLYFNGDNRIKFTAKAEPLLTITSSESTSNEAYQELVKRLNIHIWEPPIQKSSPVEDVFGTTTLPYRLNTKTQGKYTIYRAYAKLDLSVKYDVGMYSYHTKDVNGRLLLDANGEPIMVQLEPQEITCSAQLCNGSWILDVVRYENISDPHNVTLTIHPENSTLDIQDDTSNTLELTVSWNSPSIMGGVGNLNYRVDIMDHEHIIASRNLNQRSDIHYTEVFRLIQNSSNNPEQSIDLQDVWGSEIHAVVTASVELGYENPECRQNTLYSINSSSCSPQIHALVDPECLTDIDFSAFGQLENDEGYYESLVNNNNEAFISFNVKNVTIDQTTGVRNNKYQHISVVFEGTLGGHSLVESDEFPGYAKVQLTESQVNNVIDFQVKTKVISNENGETTASSETECTVMKVRLSKPNAIPDTDCVFVRSKDKQRLIVEANMYNTSITQPSHIKLDNRKVLAYIFSGTDATIDNLLVNPVTNRPEELFLIRDSFSGDTEILMSLFTELTENKEFLFRILPTFTYDSLNLIDYRGTDVVRVYPNSNVSVSYNWNTTQYTPIDVSGVPLDELPGMKFVELPTYLLKQPNDQRDIEITFYIDAVKDFESEELKRTITYHLTNNNKDIHDDHFSVTKLTPGSHLSVSETKYLVDKSGECVYKVVFNNKLDDGTYAIQNNLISSVLQFQVRAKGKGKHSKYEVQSQLTLSGTSSFLVRNNGLASTIGATYEFTRDSTTSSSGENVNLEDLGVIIRWNDEERFRPVINSYITQDCPNPIVGRQYVVELTDENNNIIKSSELRVGRMSSSNENFENVLTFNNLFFENALNQTNVEDSTNNSLLLQACIKTTYDSIHCGSGNEVQEITSESLSNVCFQFRVSKFPSVPCDLTLKQEDCYQDHPTARLEWSIDDDRYTTESFTISVRGKNKLGDVVSGSFEVFDNLFSRLNEDKLFKVTGNRTDYSLLLCLNGESDGIGMEHIKNMYQIDSYSIQRNIDTSEYTTNGATGPMNALVIEGDVFDDTDRRNGTTQTPLTFDYEPVFNSIDVTFNEPTNNSISGLSITSRYVSPSSGSIIHMLSYMINGCTYNIVKCQDMSMSDIRSTTRSSVFDISSGDLPNSVDEGTDSDNFLRNLETELESGNAQYAIILVNQSGVTIGKYPRDGSIITATNQTVNADTSQKRNMSYLENAPLRTVDFREERRVELLRRFLH